MSRIYHRLDQVLNDCIKSINSCTQ